MGSSFKGTNPDVTEDYITVKTASKFSGYNEQYLRRLLRGGIFKTRKIGQLWLIEQADFGKYFSEATKSDDKRFGPQSST
ncbi:MAG: helix-turn-helix domain-containing protein [Anaerolineales bacterium]